MKSNVKIRGVLFFVLILSSAIYSQVGINNTSPNATLDVTASNTATPANNDGILIPRVDNFPTTNPTASQDGMMIFVTGNGTPAKGFYYWDNGAGTWISIADTQNTLDQAYDEGGAGAGRTITADNGAVSIAGTDGFQVSGIFGSGAAIGSPGAGTRMFFNPRKAAFRVGEVSGTEWDNANVGDYSFASGLNTTASGFCSTAMGFLTTASGSNSIAMGSYTYASGLRSTAMGQNTIASGLGSTAMGESTTASGSYSTAMGSNTTASALTTTAMGSNTTASGSYSTAMGQATTASGFFSTSMGQLTTASGSSSTAMGQATTAPSFGETTIGTHSTNYTPASAIAFNSSDRIFSIGNGTDSANRSNALTIYKSGLMNINDEYNMPLTDGTANQVLVTNGSGQVSFVNPSAIFTDTQNTLDQAYDEGGAGAGRTITADNGAVSIAGIDGFQVSGIFGSGATIGSPGAGTRMFFNPRKAAFRAGHVNGTQWDNANVGNSSFAVGINNTASGSNSVALGSHSASSGTTSVVVGTYATASGDYSISGGYGTQSLGVSSIALGVYSDATASSSIAIGSSSTASGDRSIAVGNNATAYSFSEIAFGIYPTTYTPASTSLFDNSDRIFSIGNGIDSANRSNALTIYKSGLMNINDEYNMPLTDGTANQVMATNGAGQVSFVDPSSVYGDADWYENSGTPPNNINDNIYTYGNVGIGTTAFYRLDVSDSQASSYVARFNNTNTDSGAGGIRIRLARTFPGSSNYYIGFYSSFGTNRGRVVGNGSGVLYETASDRRLKTNIISIEKALELIDKIQPRKYEYKELKGKEEYGFIAQELQTVYPQAVSGDPNGNVETAPMMVDYSRLTPILTAGIKELKEQNEELKKELEKLKTDNEKLKKQLNRFVDLENRISNLENKINTAN